MKKSNSQLRKRTSAPLSEYIWIAGAIVLVFALLLIGYRAILNEISETKEMLNIAIPGSMDRGRSTEMTPLEIQLVNHITKEVLQLKIPKAYLTDKKNWEGGKQEILQIETGLPKLEPRPALSQIHGQPGSKRYEDSKKEYRNGIYIHWYGTQPIPDFIDRMRKRYFQNYSVVSNDKFGLIELRRRICAKEEIVSNESREKSKNCRDVGFEYFVTPESETLQPTAMNCIRPEENPSGGCNAKIRFHGRMVKYIFRRDQLSRWKEFDSGVRRLLQRFVVQVSGDET